MKEDTQKSLKMGLAASTAIGVGGMIGAGIFSILGIAASNAGTLTYVSFLISGLIALASAYSFGRLGATFPSAGGPVEFLNKGLKRGFITGTLNMLLWMGYIIVNALYARAFADYFIALFDLHVYRVFISPIIIIILVSTFFFINKIGGHSVGKSELILVILKCAILLVFALVGLQGLNSVEIVPSYSSIPTVIYTSTLIFMAYEGFGLITNAAEDMKNVRKNLPRGLLTSVLITTLIYVLVSLAVTSSISAEELTKASKYALAEAAKPYFGKVGFTIISIAALISTASALNATLYGGANVSYIMAAKGQLPAQFRYRLWQTARKGLVYTALLIIAVAIMLPIEKIAMAGSLSFLIIYGAVNYAHLKLLKHTKANRGIVFIGLISCGAGALTLARYIFIKSSWLLLVFLGMLLLSVVLEFYFMKFSQKNEEIQERY